jgi:hypothetical protein
MGSDKILRVDIGNMAIILRSSSMGAINSI